MPLCCYLCPFWVAAETALAPHPPPQEQHRRACHPPKETVLWDDALPGFGLKVTPRGKKVFIVLCRTGGAGSALRKYTIGPYGRLTLHAARAEAQKILAARLEGRDPAAEKQHKRKKLIADQVSS